MIRFRAIAYILGQFLLALAGTMLVPLVYGLVIGSNTLDLFGLSFTITALGAGLLWGLGSRPSRDLTQREGLLVVVTVWVSIVLFGCLPFYFSPVFTSFTDAFFESTSGFTTTGATVLERVEVLPNPLLLWRSFSQWLGGIGIVLLGVAVLPLVGHGGMQLYRAEFSGAKSEKLKPRITETALSLWKIYVALTVAECVFLRSAGMNSFEAICTTLSTISTGGFSTRTASIGGFESPLIEYIVSFFILLAGISFIQHYRLWVEKRPRSFFADVEVRYYFLLIFAAVAVIFATLIIDSEYSPSLAFRRAWFQTISIMTGAGFTTDNFAVWHPLPQLLLLALMFMGGCTGSTTGGLKTSRVLLLVRVVDREFKRMVERHAVFAVRLGSQLIRESTIQSLLNLIYLAFVGNFVCCVLLAAMGVDVLTSIAAVASAMFNVGPSLGGVGPAENFGHLPFLAKWVLAVCMIAGRLEFYSLLVIFTPAFWRK